MTRRYEDLLGYQHRMIDFGVDRVDTGAMFWVDMGLGKTVSTLTVVQRLLSRFDARRTLVVGPLRVARKVWKDEVNVWDHLDIDVVTACGTAKQRVEALRREADVHCINVENLPWLTDQYRAKGQRFRKPWPWDTVVLDESTRFKTIGQRWKALRRVLPHVERVYELTGEPSPNGLEDLWAQAFLVDRGARLGATKEAFLQRWFDPPGYGEFRPKPKWFALEQITQRLSDITLTLRAEDYLDLPAVHRNVVSVELGAKQSDMYRSLKRKYVLDLAEGTTISAVNAGVLSEKLLQMADGALYDEDRNVHVVHDAKVQALLEIVESLAGRPLMVFYSHRFDRDRIMSALAKKVEGARVLDSEQDEDDWNAGRIPVLVMHPASAGHGLNLQHGGETILWYGLTANLELYNQANARLIGGHRRKGKSAVIHHLVTEGTFDERVMNLIETKKAGQDAVLDAVKEVVREVTA